MSTYYCPDCKVEFNSNKYKRHVTEKKICYRCHKTYRTHKDLEIHLTPKKIINEHTNNQKLIKCKDCRTEFNEYIKNKKNIDLIESKTDKNKINVEKLENKIKRLEKKLKYYKEQGLDAIENIKNTYTEEKEDEKKDTRELIIRTKFNPITNGNTEQSGYTNDAYLSMIMGNNEDILLSAEFGNSEVDQLTHTKKIKKEYSIMNRQDHSNISSGFTSSKFNNMLEYNEEDLDNIENDVIFENTSFEENIKANNNNINKRRIKKHKNQTLDLDYDLYIQAKIEHLRIED